MNSAMCINSFRSCDIIWVPEASQHELTKVYNQLASDKQRSLIDFRIQEENDPTRYWGGVLPLWRGHYLSFSTVACPPCPNWELSDSLEAISLLAWQHLYNSKPGFGSWEGKEIVCSNNAVVRGIHPSIIEVWTFRSDDAMKNVYPVTRIFEN